MNVIKSKQKFREFKKEFAKYWLHQWLKIKWFFWDFNTNFKYFWHKSRNTSSLKNKTANFKLPQNDKQQQQ